MSRFVVHLTDDPEIFANILASGLLRSSGPFGFSWARKIPEITEQHHSVCFSEIPLHHLGRLIQRHGHYGLGFTKAFIRKNQGARVWYIDQGSRQARALNTQLLVLNGRKEYDNPLWDLTPLIDYVMPGQYEWDWEREWRVPGDLEFQLSDIALTITPDGIDEFLDPKIYETPDLDLVIAASPKQFLELLEEKVQEFFSIFEDPVNCLPVDSGEYVPIVRLWETEDAIDTCLVDLGYELRTKLADYLNNKSPTWVRSSDLASI